jgi:dihydropteroate synthase
VEALETRASRRSRTPSSLRADRGISDSALAELSRPAIVGILNVTPDSFSDGGQFLDGDAAAARANKIAEEGADFIDVGGESTRPGALPIDEAEELRRVLPVIERIRGLLPIFVDTTRAAVAARAIAAGAAVVNDVSGATADPEMLAVVAERGAGIILVHRRGTPQTMDRLAHYGDVVGEVKAFLSTRAEAAIASGVSRDRIAVDPGIGFAKNPTHNLTLLARIDEIVELGLPVLVGVSRKRFLGRVLGDAPTAERLEGTLAASLLAIAGGARLVRVHDVAPMVRALRVARAIWARRPSHRNRR